MSDPRVTSLAGRGPEGVTSAVTYLRTLDAVGVLGSTEGVAVGSSAVGAAWWFPADTWPAALGHVFAGGGGPAATFFGAATGWRELADRGVHVRRVHDLAAAVRILDWQRDDLGGDLAALAGGDVGLAHVGPEEMGKWAVLISERMGVALGSLIPMARDLYVAEVLAAVGRAHADGAVRPVGTWEVRLRWQDARERLGAALRGEWGLVDVYNAGVRPAAWLLRQMGQPTTDDSLALVALADEAGVAGWSAPDMSAVAGERGLGLDVEDADTWLVAWRGLHPGYARWAAETLGAYRRDGQVLTPYGRVLRGDRPGLLADLVDASARDVAVRGLAGAVEALGLARGVSAGGEQVAPVEVRVDPQGERGVIRCGMDRGSFWVGRGDVDAVLAIAEAGERARGECPVRVPALVGLGVGREGTMHHLLQHGYLVGLGDHVDPTRAMDVYRRLRQMEERGGDLATYRRGLSAYREACGASGEVDLGAGWD